MGIKPGRVYRIPKKRSYTRKEYMRGTPMPKITIFDMGDLAGADKFEIELSLVAKEAGQLTHNSLEAARISSNRYMVKNTGKTGYYLKCRVFPHEILRENKMASGAGADRVSDGMRRAFGKAVGLGARVKKGQKLITIKTSPQNYAIAKSALKRASAKVAVPCAISLDRGKEILKL